MSIHSELAKLFSISISLVCQNAVLCGNGLTSTLHNILSKLLAAFDITIVETMNSSERGMNPVAMTIINPPKEYWLSQGFKTATSCSQVFDATGRATGAWQELTGKSQSDLKFLRKAYFCWLIRMDLKGGREKEINTENMTITGYPIFFFNFLPFNTRYQ